MTSFGQNHSALRQIQKGWVNGKKMNSKLKKNFEVCFIWIHYQTRKLMIKSYIIIAIFFQIFSLLWSILFNLMNSLFFFIMFQKSLSCIIQAENPTESRAIRGHLDLLREIIQLKMELLLWKFSREITTTPKYYL